MAGFISNIATFRAHHFRQDGLRTHSRRDVLGCHDNINMEACMRTRIPHDMALALIFRSVF